MKPLTNKRWTINASKKARNPYLTKVGTVTSTGKASNGAGRLADTLGEGDLVVLGGDNNTTLSGLDIDGLFHKFHS